MSDQDAFAAWMLPLAVSVAWRRSLLLGTASSAGSEHGESDICGVVGALEVDRSSLSLLEAHVVSSPPGFLFTRLARECVEHFHKLLAQEPVAETFHVIGILKGPERDDKSDE